MRWLVLDVETFVDTPRDNTDDFRPWALHWPVAITTLQLGISPAGVQRCELRELKGEHRGPWVSEALAIVSEALERDYRIVTWNGRRFDVPVLIASFIRQQKRCRMLNALGQRFHHYKDGWPTHFDVLDFLSTMGAPSASLDDFAQRIGHVPAKGEIEGSMVGEMYQAGRLDEISAYCTRDVLALAEVALDVAAVFGHISALEQLTAATEVGRLRGELLT